jgi:hypothetical protein
MKILLFATILGAATAINASAVPDTNNSTALNEFEKRFFSCPFQCDLQKTWCIMGDHTKQAFTTGKIYSAAQSCRCRRLKDEPRCGKKCGYKCPA